MNYDRLYNLKSNKILIIGDIMLDIYQYGNCSRISPEAPVPVVDFIREEKMLGGAGNVLKNLVSFGANCEIISVIGKDISGKIIIEKINELNVDSRLLIIDKNRQTTEKNRIVTLGQQLLRIDKEDKKPINVNLETKIIRYIKQNIKNFDVIIFSDYMKGVLTNKICAEIIKIAKMNNILTLVDPKGSNYKKYKNIDLIKPNLKEAEILIGEPIRTKEDIKIACQNIKKLLECKYVVITLAEEGIALMSENFETIPTESCQVFDVSGAGDTVLASLAICLKQKYSLFESCIFSNKAASVVIRKFGSATTTIPEVINLK